jgi:mandelate racemase
MHVLVASPTAQILEYVPWAQPIMGEKMVIHESAAIVSPRPGLGLVFDDEAVERYAFD